MVLFQIGNRTGTLCSLSIKTVIYKIACSLLAAYIKSTRTVVKTGKKRFGRENICFLRVYKRLSETVDKPQTGFANQFPTGNNKGSDDTDLGLP